ncbi:caspase family protein [Silvibacterium acidisoli]|uniref:caspase family protein n=1 Tax=Acidobacteriaceae bacterium ZG23-2 TaxID=2883246 RepID=UPI00406C0CC4
MLTRRAVIELTALSLLSPSLPFAWAATDARRRALVIGIDKYVYASQSSLYEDESIGGAHVTASASLRRGSRFSNLDGAVNDAQLMNQILKDRYGFTSADIVFLTNGDATRARILQEFRSHLVDSASANDVSLFYYAGHGSQVHNTASDEAGQFDQTIVPADSESGAPDIRDKEMSRLYRAALDKHVQLTVILDSCHSGGMSRGAWNSSGKVRYLPPGPNPVNDPPDIDPSTGQKYRDPTSRSMLFLGAAREDQPAAEITVTVRDATGTRKDLAHGVFTAALSQVLQSAIANQSVEQICTRVQSIMASQGSVQLPICGGSGRQTRGLLGVPAGEATSLTVAVESITGPGTLKLRGGSAIGLATGCTLARTNPPAIRVELTDVTLGGSEARLLDASSNDRVNPGDLFRLETWVAPPQQVLSVFFTRDAPDAAAILGLAKSLDQLSQQSHLRLISDPLISSPPTHVLYWRTGGYFLERFPRAGSAVALGKSPSYDDLANHLTSATDIRLWPILPVDGQTASALKLGAGTENLAVNVVPDPAASVYLLAGSLRNGKITYSWIFKDALIASPAGNRLPMRTDWATSPDELTSLATRLARIYGWLNLNGPSGGDPSFPYLLSMEKFGGNQPAGSGPFKFGERFKFIFTADPRALSDAANSGGVSRRYVYVFLIDSAGDATCLFPDPNNGNVGNLLPRTDPPEPRIVATRNPFDLEIGEPAGTDNYFIIASADPLDPGAFQWTGVRHTENRRGQSALDLLFSSVTDGTRGGSGAPKVPANWSIQSFSVRSTP